MATEPATDPPAEPTNADVPSAPGTANPDARNALIPVPTAPPVPTATAPVPALAVASAPMTPPLPTTTRACPHCAAPNPAQATNCVTCGQQMTRPCPNCGLPLLLAEQACSRCHTPVTEYDHRRFVEAIAIEGRVQQERRESDARVEALEGAHLTRARFGVVFWLVVLAALGGVIAAALYFGAAAG